MEWTSFGDVNPIEHGGIWVREDKDIPGGNQFYIVRWEPENVFGEEGAGMFSDAYIDITDSWIDLPEVEAYADLGGQTEENKLEYVQAIFSYYGAYHCNGTQEVVNVPQLRKLLEGWQITIEQD